MPRRTSQPDVIVDFVFEDGLLFIAVENLASRPVHCVRIRFEPSLHGVAGQIEMNALPLFRSLEFLAPRRQIRTFLDHSAAYFERGEPERVTVRINYRDERGTTHHAEITHGLSIYRDIGYVRLETATT